MVFLLVVPIIALNEYFLICTDYNQSCFRHALLGLPFTKLHIIFVSLICLINEIVLIGYSLRVSWQFLWSASNSFYPILIKDPNFSIFQSLLILQKKNLERCERAVSIKEIIQKAVLFCIWNWHMQELW
eukprot:TRINITY_DN4313_c2_g1_i3.p1 TRINITY_DN4313_c2_g1~~TRINITY_DN4313_c2_g1_i3.p1  ORF type:complete len:129 (-),score=2.64 TRINITY_DN4313_c2_g1_i3:59-445(-)